MFKATAAADRSWRDARLGWRRRGTILVALLALGGCADAAAMLGLGETASGSGPKSAYARGRDYLAAGHFGLAARDFQAVVQSDPDSVEALNGLAATYDRLGRYDLSARAYGRALAANPESAQTLNNIGYSYMLQGKFDLATVFLRDASRRDATDPAIAANRAIAEAALRASLPRAATGGTDPMERPAPPRLYIERTTPVVQTLVSMPVSAPLTAAMPAAMDTLSGPLAAPIGDTRLAADRDRLPRSIAAAIDAARLPPTVADRPKGGRDAPSG